MKNFILRLHLSQSKECPAPGTLNLGSVPSLIWPYMHSTLVAVLSQASSGPHSYATCSIMNAAGPAHPSSEKAPPLSGELCRHSEDEIEIETAEAVCG